MEIDVWMRTRIIVVTGATIHNGAVIGAGSVVTKDVNPYEIWAGNPARFIRKRFDDETIEKLQLSKWWEFGDDRLTILGEKITDPAEFLKAME